MEVEGGEEEYVESGMKIGARRVLVEGGTSIPDSMVKAVLKEKGVDVEDEEVMKNFYLEPERGNPPYFWDGENTKPNEMARYMFGDEDGNTEYTGGYGLVEKEVYLIRKIGEPGYVGYRNRYPKRRERYKKLEREIISRLEEDVGLNVGLVAREKKPEGMVEYIASNRKKSGSLGNSRGKKRTVNLMCLNCADKERNEYSPVLRMAGYEKKKEGNMMEYGYRILDVFFHNVECRKDRKARQTWHVGVAGEGRNGWKLIECGNDKKGSMKEALRAETFDGWIKALYRAENPICRLYSRVDLKEPENLEKGPLEEWKLRKWLSWVLYEIICRLNLAEEWTIHIPHRSPGPCVGKPYGPGQFPLAERGYNNLPVHLYMGPSSLVIGGMELDLNDERKVLKEVNCREEAHVDDVNEEHRSADQCVLLKGLTSPLTFNVALEGERVLWVENANKMVGVKKNEILAICCDTVYGGTCYEMKPKARTKEKKWWKPQYKPSFHGFLGSKRYPASGDLADSKIAVESDLTREHMYQLDEDGIVGTVRKVDQLWQNVFYHYQERKMNNAEVNEIFTKYGMLEEQEQNGRTRKKRG